MRSSIVVLLLAAEAASAQPCYVLDTFGQSGINSMADLEANGWTHSAAGRFRFNNPSYATSPDFFQFFAPTGEIAFIEHTIPQGPGTVKVRYGRDYKGTTKLLVGGQVVDELSADNQDHLYTGPYNIGDTVRIEDHDTNVALIRSVEYCFTSAAPTKGVLASGTKSCVCSGDPHCKTFDGKKYDWMGRCDYTFAKDERVGTGFEVQIRNTDGKDRGPDKGVATMILSASVKLPPSSSAELWMDGYSCEGAEQGPYLGTSFQTPAQCLLEAANTAGCGQSVIWSPAKNSEWGCRCCTPSFNTPTNQNAQWQLWRVGAPQSDVVTLVRDPNCITWEPWYPAGQSDGWPGKVNGAPLQIPYQKRGLRGVVYSITYEANPRPDFVGWNANGKTIKIHIPSLKASVYWTTCFRIEMRLEPGSPLVGNTGGMCADANGNLDGEMALVEDKCYHAVQPSNSLFETQKSGCPDDTRCVEPPKPPMCDTPAALEACSCFDAMGACHRAIPAKEFYEACMFDACAMPGHEAMAASNCADYESDCCDMGIPMPQCPPWTVLTMAPTFGVITAAPNRDEGFEVTAQGDPFTTYNGKRTQFWLPLTRKTLLIKSTNGVALFAGVMPTGIEGDSQQWFNAIDVHEYARKVLSIGVDANATMRPAATNMDDVSIIMPPKHLLGDRKKLEIITVSVAGEPMTHTTTLPVTIGSISMNISKSDTETVHFASPGLAARVQASEATKFTAGNKARKYTHLDLAFTNIVNVTSFTGILPEVWGVKAVSEETASMLIPPTR